eukprot:scaffold10067_cov73-Skeletonema_marinoi.AAC.1
MLFPTQRQSYGCLPPYEDRRLGNDEGCTVYLFCDRLVQLLCCALDERVLVYFLHAELRRCDKRRMDATFKI